MSKIVSVALYIRVSSDEQKLHGLSLDAQRMKLKEYCQKKGYKIVKYYNDEGVSGRKPIKKRPQLQQLLVDAKDGMFEIVLFIKLDRYFRSVAEYHECQKILDQYNVSWIATEEKYDLTTANGRAFVNMKLTIAELEADQTSERIKLVNEYKLKQGYALSGAVPFGFKTKREGNHSQVVIDEETKKIVLETIEVLERIRGVRRTIDFITTKYDLDHTYKVLRTTLKSPLLYGCYRDNLNYCEPYISKERYDSIQEIMSKNIKDNTKFRKYIFTSLIRCGSCGRNLTGSYSIPNSNGDEFYSYRCNIDHFKKRCDRRSYVSEKIIENYLIENIQEELKKYMVEVDATSTAPGASSKNNIAKIKNEMNRLNIIFRKNRIDEKEYDSEYNKLDNLLKKAVIPTTEVKKDLTHLKTVLNDDIFKIYNRLDRVNKRAFWQTIIKEVVIDYSTGDRVFKIVFK